jgi:hypothetical protein
MYWTTEKDAPKYLIISLFPTNTMLRPGETETVALAPPPDPGPWRADFGFNLEPSPTERTLHGIKEWILDSVMPSGTKGRAWKYDQLSVFLSPTITNRY